MQQVGHAEFFAALRLDHQRALGDHALDLPLRAPVLRGVALVTEQETALPQMGVELAMQVFGRAYVQRVRAKNSAHRIAERALAGPRIADEHGRDRGLLARILYRPRQPIVIVAIDFLIARRQHFAQVLAHQTPITALGRDAPSGPEVEAFVDDATIIARTENQPAILPPVAVMEPPCPYVDPLGLYFVADVDAPVEIEIA